MESSAGILRPILCYKYVHPIHQPDLHYYSSGFYRARPCFLCSLCSTFPLTLSASRQSLSSSLFCCMQENEDACRACVCRGDGTCNLACSLISFSRLTQHKYAMYATSPPSCKSVRVSLGHQRQSTADQMSRHEWCRCRLEVKWKGPWEDAWYLDPAFWLAYPSLLEQLQVVKED